MYRSWKNQFSSFLRSWLASIPGRVFAFITVRQTTGPGTSCLRMRQIFIVYLWLAKIFNKSIIEICTQKMQSEYTKDAHRELLHKGLGSCQLCCSTITVTQGNFKMIECLQITFQKDLAGCWTSLILGPNS